MPVSWKSADYIKSKEARAMLPIKYSTIYFYNLLRLQVWLKQQDYHMNPSIIDIIFIMYQSQQVVLKDVKKKKKKVVLRNLLLY